MKPPRDDQHLTPPEVAKMLRVHPDRVVAWIKGGQLAASNVSDCAHRPLFRVSRESLADFLERRRPNPPRSPARRRRIAAAAGKKYY